MSSDKVQILVVDDDISHCTILQALLRGWGWKVQPPVLDAVLLITEKSPPKW